MVVNEANQRGMAILHTQPHGKQATIDMIEDPYGSRRMTAENNKKGRHRYSSIQNERSISKRSMNKRSEVQGGARGGVGLHGS